MRVLWLCDSPALGADLVHSAPGVGYGWVAALEPFFLQRSDVDLSVAIPSDTAEVRAIESERGGYLTFPRYPRGGRLRRRLIDLSCRLEPSTEVDFLLRVVELARPDLIHVWGTESFLGLVAGRCEVPVLIEIQGIRAPLADAYCSGLTKLDLLRFGSPKRLLLGKSLFHRYYRYRKTAEREREILAGARFLSGRTEWDRLVCSVLAPRARYFHCDRVLRPPFYRAKWVRRQSEASRELRLITIARGNAYKGIETLCRCASLVKELTPGGLRWTIVGVRRGDEIQRIVERKLGMSFDRQGIRLLGRVPAEGVVKHLLEHDIYVHPSRLENSPNGLSEAMLVGMPVISTSAGGVPSLLKQDEEGLLVPVGDPWALAGAILRLAGDQELADRLASGARQRALPRHDPAAIVGAEVEIYRQILADRRG